MQLPLCDLDAEKAQLEEALIRYVTLNVDNADRLMKEMAMKLFAVSISIRLFVIVF